ncbi:MAG: hypothetical protein ACE5E9_10025 [Nitrospinaceae bacterium]
MLCQALSDGYREKGNTACEEWVGLHTVAGLFRIVMEPFRHRPPEGPEKMETILEQVK